ncbi:MAG: hypothetical protein ACRBFS_24220 [Aureispira sp.]
MHSIKALFIFCLSLSTTYVLAQEQDYRITHLHLEKSVQGTVLILEGEGAFEAVVYPDLYIYINDKQVNLVTELVIVDFDKPASQRFTVNIDELPEEFTAKFVLKTKDLKAEPIVLLYEQKATPPQAAYTIKNISLIKKGDQRFLKIEFDPFSNAVHWSYPLFKVELDGQLIAERGLSTYALVETELIPTTINKLPKAFECNVIISQHGNNQVKRLSYRTQ